MSSSEGKKLMAAKPCTPSKSKAPLSNVASKKAEHPTRQESSMTTAARKRDRDEDEDLDDITPEEFSKMNRSERKRHREKKRRSDVNKGFDELMTLLLEIDPVVRSEAEERSRRGQWKGQYGAQEDNLLSRVDLIGRTITVLRRLHRENEERKQVIASLTSPANNNTSLRSMSGEEESVLMPTLLTPRGQSAPDGTAVEPAQLLQRAARGEIAALNEHLSRAQPPPLFGSLPPASAQSQFSPALSLQHQILYGRALQSSHLVGPAWIGFLQGRQAPLGISGNPLDQLAISQYLQFLQDREAMASSGGAAPSGPAPDPSTHDNTSAPGPPSAPSSAPSTTHGFFPRGRFY